MIGTYDTLLSMQSKKPQKDGDGNLMIELFFKLEYPKGYEYSFKCPSLFIAGEEKLLMASKILDYMKNLFKDNMHFETIAGSFHHVPIDAPIEMTKIVKRAIDKWL